MKEIPSLSPGDHLLYTANSIFGKLIQIKTWSKVSHIEIYRGDGKSLASRDGQGVNVYPLRITELAYVLRPKTQLNLPGLLTWFETVRDQKYDWAGILCFTFASRHGDPDKMFCSEFVTRADRILMSTPPIHSCWDADHVAPCNFLMSPMFDWIYTSYE